MASRSLRALSLLVSLTVVAAVPARGQCPGWTSDLAAPGVSGSIYASAVFDDGSGPALYVAGMMTHAPGIEVDAVARWNGTTWSAVGAEIEGRVYALTVHDDGTGPKLFAAGAFELPGDTDEVGRVVRWDGSQWTPVGPAFPPEPDAGYSAVRALAVFDAGDGPQLHAAGTFGHGSVAVWDGASWSTVGGGLFISPLKDLVSVNALHVFDDGLGGGPSLYAGGLFLVTQSGTPITRNIARLAGGTWVGVGNGVAFDEGNQIYAITTFDDGSGSKLVIGGNLASSSVAFLDGSSWSFLSGAPVNVCGVLRTIDAASGLDAGLWVGGDFAPVGGQPAADLARWDGASWHVAPGSTALGNASGLSIFDAGSGPRLFAAGTSGVVQELELGAWSHVSTGGGADGNVTRLLEVELPGFDPELWASGTFSSIGGVAAPGLARWNGEIWTAEDTAGLNLFRAEAVLDVGSGPELFGVGTTQSGWRIVRRQGSSWIELPQGPTHVGALAAFDTGNGPELYAAGFGLWRFDGTSWSNVIGQPSQPIRSMIAFDDGSGTALYLGGGFQTIGGVAYRGIARWDGTTLDALAGGTSAGGKVDRLCLYDDGSGTALYAAGGFTTIGGVPASCFARWDGQGWSEVGGGLPGVVDHATVNAMVVDDDGSGAGPELVVGAIGLDGQVMRWNGTSWRTMDGGVSVPNPVIPGAPLMQTLAVFDDGSGHGPDLFVGGNFLRAGGLESSHIARWEGCGGSVAAFCFGDGSGAACPCGNAGLPGHGCRNSATIRGAELGALGNASVGTDTLRLTSTFELPNATSIFLQGDQAIAPTFFGDGLRCVGGSLKRLYVANANGAGAVTSPASGAPSISQRSSELGDAIPAGGTRWYQVYYRDPSPSFCPEPQGATFNVSNGLSVLWHL